MSELKKELYRTGILLTFEQWYELNKTALEWGNLPKESADYYLEYVEETVADYKKALGR